MNLNLIAIAPFDGWAYVKDNGAVYLIKPPYNIANKVLAGEEQKGMAVAKYGFYECNETFDSYPQLTGFLKERYKELNKAIGRNVEPVSTDEILKFINNLPADKIREFGDKIESDFIEAEKYADAIKLIGDVLNIEKVKNDKTLKAHFNKLKKLAKQGAEQGTERKLMIWLEKFHLSDNIQPMQVCKRQARVSERRELLEM